LSPTPSLRLGLFGSMRKVVDVERVFVSSSMDA